MDDQARFDQARALVPGVRSWSDVDATPPLPLRMGVNEAGEETYACTDCGGDEWVDAPGVWQCLNCDRVHAEPPLTLRVDVDPFAAWDGQRAEDL